MKDFRGREVYPGHTVVYYFTGGLDVVSVVEADGDKVTVLRNGENKTVTWKDEKAVLILDPTVLA